MTSEIFDKELYKSRLRSRAKQQNNFLMSQMEEIAIECLKDINREFTEMAIISPFPVNINPSALILDTFSGDGTRLPLEAESFDAIISINSLSRVNDVPGMFAQAANALKADGLFLCVFLGGETLFELRNAITEAEIELFGGTTARVHPTIDIRDAGSLVQRTGFSLPVIDSTILKASYENATKLMRDLRKMGETNILIKRSKTPITKGFLDKINTIYTKKFADGENRVGENRVTASFEIITITAWKPHESQQKPAKRGSGKISLESLK